MKTRRAIFNFFTDVIPLVIISILGIFKLKVFIDVLGTEIEGEGTQFLSQTKDQKLGVHSLLFDEKEI